MFALVYADLQREDEELTEIVQSEIKKLSTGQEEKKMTMADSAMKVRIIEHL